MERICFSSHTLQVIMTIGFWALVAFLADWGQDWENEYGSEMVKKFKKTVYCITWWVPGEDGPDDSYSASFLLSIMLINAAQPFCFG